MTHCPACRVGRLDRIAGEVAETMLPGCHILGRPLPVRVRPAVFDACNRCDYCAELQPSTPSL